MTISIFLDTEFTNINYPNLISIGLISNNGETFYAQQTLTEKWYTPYITQKVLPHLDVSFLPQNEIADQLQNWLKKLDDNFVIYSDKVEDWQLLKTLLINSSHLIGYTNIEQYFQSMSQEMWSFTYPHLCHKAYQALLDTFFLKVNDWKKNNGRLYQHALYNAMAEKFAFEETELLLRFPIHVLLKNKI